MQYDTVAPLGKLVRLMIRAERPVRPPHLAFRRLVERCHDSIDNGRKLPQALFGLAREKDTGGCHLVM